jgi:hypothetical protein
MHEHEGEPGNRHREASRGDADGASRPRRAIFAGSRRAAVRSHTRAVA